MGENDEHGAAEFLIIRQREKLQVGVDFFHLPVLDDVFEPGEDLSGGIFWIPGAKGTRGDGIVVEQQAAFQFTAGIEDFSHPDRVRILEVIEELADDDVLLTEMDSFPHEAERAG